MTRIIVTKGVKEYRETIRQHVHADDIVLEIGFAWGTTTDLIAGRCQKVVGIDKGESYYRAVEQYPHLEFHKIDGFDVSAVLKLGYRFTKIYIDISGCRDIFDVIKIVLIYRSVFRPEVIVVKSSQLKRFVSACELWE